MKPLLPHCFLLLSPLGKEGLVIISSAFYFSPSQIFFGKAWQRFPESDSHSDPCRLSARARSQLDSTKVFPLPGLKIAFYSSSMPGIHPATVESVISSAQPDAVSSSQSQSFYPIWSAHTTLICFGFLGHRASLKMSVQCHVVGGRREPWEGSWSFLCWCFMEGKNQALFSWTFLCLVISTAQQKGFSDQVAGSTGSGEVQKWSVLPGGAKIPQRYRVEL